MIFADHVSRMAGAVLLLTKVLQRAASCFEMEETMTNTELNAYLKGAEHERARCVRIIEGHPHVDAAPKMVLVAAIRKEEPGEYWTNIYRNDDGSIWHDIAYKTRAEAEEYAHGDFDRIACVRSSWKEGDGL